jgi:hypothetical protein
MVEGVVGLMMVIGGTVLAVVLLLNAIAATYNKEKIGFVANTAAVYAGTLPNNAARQGLVTAKVNQLLAGMALHASNTTVTVSDLTITTRPAVKVTVATSLPTLLFASFSSVLPSSIRTSDTAVAFNRCWFWGYGVGIHPLGPRWTSPITNATGALPADKKPAWTVLIPVSESQLR